MEKKNIIIGPGGDYQWGGMDDTHPADLLKNKAPTIENMRLDKYGVPSKRNGQSEYATDITTAAGVWTHQYDGADVPDAGGAYDWTKATLGTPTASSDGDICTFTCGTEGDLLRYSKTPTLDNAAGTDLLVRFAVVPPINAYSYVGFIIDDGTKYAQIRIDRQTPTAFRVQQYDSQGNSVGDAWTTTTDPGGYKLLRFMLWANKFYVWVDGELVLSGYPENTVSGKIQFEFDANDSEGEIKSTFDYLYYSTTPGTPAQGIDALYAHKDPGREDLLLQAGATIWRTKDGSNFSAIRPIVSNNYTMQAVTMYSGDSMSYKTYIVNGSDRMFKWAMGAITLLDDDDSGGAYRFPWGRCITAHEQILLVGHHPLYANSLFYSRLTNDSGAAVEPDTVVGDNAEAWSVLQRIDIPEGRGIVGIKALSIGRDVITLIGMEDACYTLLGNSTQTFDLDKLDSHIGCLSRDTMRVWKGQVVFLGQEEGKIGVFGYNGSERVKNLSHGMNGSIRAVLESANIPKFRYWLTSTGLTDGTDSEWDLWTLTEAQSDNDDIFGEGYIQIVDGQSTGIAESPAHYCGNVTEWGVLESSWSQESVGTNRITFEIKTATTEAGLSGESYSEYFIGEKLQETTGSSVWMQAKVTLARDDNGHASPVCHYFRPTWADGGEWREVPTAIVHEDSYLLSLSDSTTVGSAMAGGYGTKYNNIILRMDADGNWTKYTAHRVASFAKYRGLLLGGHANEDTIRQLDTGTQDVSTDFSTIYDSPIITVAPGMKARFDHTAYIDTKGVTALNVYYRLDRGAWSSAIAVSPASTNMESTRFTIAAKTYFRTCQIKIEQTTAVSNFEIHKMRFALQVLPKMGD